LTLVMVTVVVGGEGEGEEDGGDTGQPQSATGVRG